jgi:hypothetical protein
MSQDKYIGTDVHQATISIAVLDSRGKLVMESRESTAASASCLSMAARAVAHAG